jgi:hypothetical protein
MAQAAALNPAELVASALHPWQAYQQLAAVSDVETAISFFFQPWPPHFQHAATVHNSLTM